MVQNVEVTVLAFRNVGIEFEVINTRRVIAEHDDLVVTKGEVGSHSATCLTKNAVFGTTRLVAPSGPRITIGLSDFSAGNAVVEIIAHLCESIAANEGNHRNE